MAELFPEFAAPAVVKPVYVDELFVMASRNPQAFRTGLRHGHRWCHLWSDDLEALHAMARKLRMLRAWFQDKPGFPHYDLVPPRRAAAVILGAVEMPLREWMEAKRIHRQDAETPRGEEGAAVDLSQPRERRLLAVSLYGEESNLALKECDQAHSNGDCPLCGGICHMCS